MCKHILVFHLSRWSWSTMASSTLDIGYVEKVNCALYYIYVAQIIYPLKYRRGFKMKKCDYNRIRYDNVSL